MFIIRPVVILIPCFHIEVLVNTTTPSGVGA